MSWRLLLTAATLALLTLGVALLTPPDAAARTRPAALPTLIDPTSLLSPLLGQPSNTPPPAPTGTATPAATPAPVSQPTRTGAAPNLGGARPGIPSTGDTPPSAVVDHPPTTAPGRASTGWVFALAAALSALLLGLSIPVSIRRTRARRADRYAQAYLRGAADARSEQQPDEAGPQLRVIRN